MICLKNLALIKTVNAIYSCSKLTQTRLISSLQRQEDVFRILYKANSNTNLAYQCCLQGNLAKFSLLPQLPSIIVTRNSAVGFYNKWPADRLWKGLTGVSNAGRKKGRASGNKRKRIKNLNRGQYLGDGEKNMVWPGLNAPILEGKTIVKQQELPKNEERMEKLLEIRDKMGVFKSKKLSPLERGWSGNKMPGRSIGPPDPVGEDKFEGFDTKVLELKSVTKMDGRLGRKRSLSMLAVTGNKNGLAGFALAKGGGNIMDISRICRNKAGKKLVYIERCENHTVFYNFFCKYLETKIFVSRKPEGFGLHCHPAIREICQVVGIKNLYAKVEGSTNVQKITKAFFLGLLNQRSHQQLAEEKGLYVVKLRHGDYPRVVAKPESKEVRSRDQIPMDEEIDLNLYSMDGKVHLARKAFQPFYVKLPSYETHLKKLVKSRNHEKIKLQQTLEYGEVVSFLTQDHPEANPLKKIVVDDEY